MDDGSAVRSGGSRAETDASALFVCGHEAALIAEAEQELADGRGISGRDWTGSWHGSSVTTTDHRRLAPTPTDRIARRRWIGASSSDLLRGAT